MADLASRGDRGRDLLPDPGPSPGLRPGARHPRRPAGHRRGRRRLAQPADLPGPDRRRGGDRHRRRPGGGRTPRPRRDRRRRRVDDGRLVAARGPTGPGRAGRPRLDGPQPPPGPVVSPARGARRHRRPGRGDAGGRDGRAAPPAASPTRSTMIDVGRARRGRHRRPHHDPRRPRPRRDRARAGGPRREAAGGHRRRGPGRSSTPAPRPACRSRWATSSGSTRPSSSSAGCSRRAGCRRSTRSRAAGPGPFPARIRDVGVTVDLATHDVDILSWIAGERPIRVYAELAQRIHATHEDLLFGLLHFPSGATGMLDVNWLTPAKRRQLRGRRRGGDVRARLPDPAADLHPGRHRPPPLGPRLRPDLRR